MTETTAEIFIVILNALGAGLLMFIAGVLQKIMNNMEAYEFKKFINTLDKTAMNDQFAVTVATLPLIAVVCYFIFYGFNHWWFITGIIVWIIGSSMTKVINLPIYKWLLNPKNNDPKEIKEKRHKLQSGNTLRAWTTLISIILMTMQFSILATIITVVIFVIIAIPLTKFSRNYKL